jgi:hypothetical protein
MKRGIIVEIVFTIAVFMIFTSCKRSDDEPDIVPVVLGLDGPTTVMQSEIHTYTPSYDREGSTWSWSVSGAVLQSVSGDTRTATVEFNTYPPNGIATITVMETTNTGIESAEKVFEITVLEIGDMTVDFYWNKDITIPGVGTISAKDYVDFDFFYANANDFDPNDVWATYIDWAADTDDHPEFFSFEGMVDGSYYFIANLYANALAGLGANTSIPISAVFNRPGTILEDYEVLQPAEYAMDSEQQGWDPDRVDFNMVLFRVTIANDKYTIFDAHNTDLGTYKKSGAGKTPRVIPVKQR